jgi:hypothetical protein
MNEPLFTETQRFRQKWILFLLCFLWIGSLLLSILLVTKKKAELWAVGLSFIAFTAFVLGFISIRLESAISSEAIRYRFFPIQWKFRMIKRVDIKRLETITYDPLTEYGGWGIRAGRKGWAYTVSGNKGLLITLVDDTNILIGTCKPQELMQYLLHNGYLA